MKRLVALALLLAAAWLLWSGHYETLVLSMGLASCLLVVLLARLFGLFDNEGVPTELMTWRMAGYLPWLAKEVLLANLDVARRILGPRLPISPRLIRVPAGQRSEAARVVYANSITLTPGTISVEVDGDTIVVHALTRDAAAGLQTDEMNRRVAALEAS